MIEGWPHIVVRKQSDVRDAIFRVFEIGNRHFAALNSIKSITRCMHRDCIRIQIISRCIFEVPFKARISQTIVTDE